MRVSSTIVLSLMLLVLSFASPARAADTPPGAKPAPGARAYERMSARAHQASKAGGKFSRGLTRTGLVLGGAGLIVAGVYQGPSPSGVACLATGCNLVALGTSKKQGFWKRVGIGGAITATTAWFGGQAVGPVLQGAAPVVKIGGATLMAAGGAASGRVVGKVSKEQVRKITAPIIEPIKRKVIEPLGDKLDKLTDRFGF